MALIVNTHGTRASDLCHDEIYLRSKRRLARLTRRRDGGVHCAQTVLRTRKNHATDILEDTTVSEHSLQSRRSVTQVQVGYKFTLNHYGRWYSDTRRCDHTDSID